MSRISTTLFMVSALLAPGLAFAVEGGHPTSDNHIEGVRLDAHINFGGYASWGAGFRVDVPIVRNGLIASVDDELAISPGADVFFWHAYHDYYDGGPYLIPSVVLQWNFYVGPDWSIFPEAGLAMYVGDSHYLRGGAGFYLAPDFGFGARYHFSPRNAFLMRLSTPTGFQLGITF